MDPLELALPVQRGARRAPIALSHARPAPPSNSSPHSGRCAVLAGQDLPPTARHEDTQDAVDGAAIVSAAIVSAWSPGVCRDC